MCGFSFTHTLDTFNIRISSSFTTKWARQFYCTAYDFMMCIFSFITLGLQKALQGKLGRPSDHCWFSLGSWILHCPACTSDHYWFSLGSWLQPAGQTLGSVLIFPRIMESALSCLYLGSLLIFPRIMAPLLCLPASWADPRITADFPSDHGFCTVQPVPRITTDFPSDHGLASWADPRFMNSVLCCLYHFAVHTVSHGH